MESKDIETEANLFALFLLMPRDLLMDELLKLGGIDLNSDDQMKSICKKFGVAQTALACRIGLLSKSDKQKLGI